MFLFIETHALLQLIVYLRMNSLDSNVNASTLMLYTEVKFY